MCFSAFLLSACGGFSSSTSLSPGTNSGSGQGNSGSGGGGGGTTTPTLEQVTPELRASAQGGEDSGYRILDVDWVRRKIKISFPLSTLPIFGADTSIAFGQIMNPANNVALVTASDGRLYLQFELDIKQFLKGILLTDPAKLPNGQPLPRTPDGELPALAGIVINANKKIKLHIYLGKATIAVYVNSPFMMPLGILSPIRSDVGRILGYVGTIASIGGTDKGGFYLTFKLPADVIRLLDDLL